MFSIFDNIAFGGTYSPAAVGQEFAFLNAVGEYKPETRYNPYCDGLRCYDRDDYFPVGYSEEELRSIYYDLNQEDGMDLLVETAGFDEVDEYYNPGEEEVERAFVLEALVFKKFSSLEKIIRRAMLPAMRKHMKAKDPTIGDPITVLEPIVGKPKKSGGFAYVTAQIPFSDGQVVSIVFHAPEGDGRKIGPSDVVVAFRWLLNKRDITAVVDPENGREVTFETVSLRLAQLVGKNAKRFASSQKEVQADKKKLEELTEKEKELDEQNKAYEDKIARGLQEKEDHASEIGALQAKLARQLAINREFENKLAGLRKAEAEARNNETEREGRTEPIKTAKAQPADEDVLLTKTQAATGDKKEKRLYQPLDNAASVFRADPKEGRKVPENTAEASEPQMADDRRLQETKAQVVAGDNGEKALYQQLVDGEFNSLPYGKFFLVLKKLARETGNGLSTETDWGRRIITVAVSYLDANSASIADAMKDQKVYGKSITETLLADSKAMIWDAIELTDIIEAFDLILPTALKPYFYCKNKILIKSYGWVNQTSL